MSPATGNMQNQMKEIKLEECSAPAVKRRRLKDMQGQAQEVQVAEDLVKEEATGVARIERSQFIKAPKQSGMRQVNWNSSCYAWQVEFPTFDKKGKKKGRTSRQFSLSQFMKEGFSETEASHVALEGAKAFCSELIKQGILKEPKPVDPNFTSEVIGVSLHKQSKKWRVRLCSPGKKEIFGGYFTEKSAAEAKALELAKEHGLERRVKAVGKLSELPIFKPKVPYPGVTWRQAEQQWRACCRVNGVQRNFRVKPKDHSEVELEASFKKAVAWKKRQEKEKRKTLKTKKTKSSKKSTKSRSKK